MAFYAKLLRDLEGAFLLLKQGMISQGRSLLRIAIECEILLARVCLSADFCESYLLYAESQRLKLLKGVQQIKTGDFDEVRSVITKELVSQLETSIEARREQSKQKTIFDCASAVNLGTVYNTAYRLFSEDVHSNIGAIKSYLRYGSEGNVASINWEPTGENCRAELSEVSRSALNGLSNIGLLYKLAANETYSILFKEYQRLEDIS
ncbi:MAG: hypothetical protein H8K07_20340 [Nitrospira sp.]|nr:hypothetical protein [Nitrospira sp.]